MEFLTHGSTSGSGRTHSYNKVLEMMRIKEFQNFDEVNRPADIKKGLLVSVPWDMRLEIGDGLVWINDDRYMAVGK